MSTGPGCGECDNEKGCQMRPDKLLRPDVFKEPCKFKKTKKKK